MINLLADRLRLLRSEKNITQSTLAQIILVPRVTYAHYELGKRTPDLDTIIRLARYYCVTVDYLIGNSDQRLSGTYDSGELPPVKVAEE